jgi:hypothetical protein
MRAQEKGCDAFFAFQYGYQINGLAVILETDAAARPGKPLREEMRDLFFAERRRVDPEKTRKGAEQPFFVHMHTTLHIDKYNDSGHHSTV